MHIFRFLFSHPHRPFFWVYGGGTAVGWCLLSRLPGHVVKVPLAGVGFASAQIVFLRVPLQQYPLASSHGFCAIGQKEGRVCGTPRVRFASRAPFSVRSLKQGML